MALNNESNSFITTIKHQSSLTRAAKGGARHGALAGLVDCRLRLFDEIEELLARLGVVAEHAEHLAGHCLAVDLLDAPHDHAHVT